MILKEILILISLSIWIIITTLSYEFYTTAKENRFKFRYWFAIGILNIFQLVILGIFVAENSFDALHFKLLSRMIVNVLMLELFIAPIARRKIELLVRSSFYFMLMLNATGSTPFFLMTNVVVLIVLAFKSEYYTVRRIFPASLFFYSLTILTSYFQGPFGFATLGSNIVFASSLAYGIKKLYEEEQTHELVKQKMREKISKENH